MILILIILLSLALGSFANNIISHFINDSKFDLFRSKCFCGEKRLELVHLIPILSFIVLKGRCHFCKDKLSYRYFFVECTSLFIGIMSYQCFPSSVEVLLYTVLFVVLFCIGIIDYYRYIIPNALILTLLVLFLTTSILKSHLPVINLLPASSILILLVIGNYFSEKARGISLIGLGDLKLITVLLLFINVPASFIALWLSSLIAIPGFYLLKITNNRFSEMNKVPFGFFLSLGFITVILFEKKIINLYLNFVGLNI